MELCIITPGQFPIPPLMGTSIEIFAHHLTNQLAQHFNVTVISRKIGSLPSIEKRGMRKDIRVKAKNISQYLVNILKIIEEEEPDWIQIENRPKYILWLKEKLPDKKMILFLHSLTFIQKLPNVLAESALTATDIIFVNSQSVHDQLSQLFPNIETPIRVIHYGIDQKRFISRLSEKGKIIRSNLRKRLGLENKKVLLFIGRIVPEKGLHLLLTAMPSILKEEPSTHLVIVGSSLTANHRHTPYVEKLRKLSIPIKKQISFLNYIPPFQIPRIYTIADLVVTPSVWEEAFCLVNLEAAASGVPVISNQVGGIPEVMEHGYNAFLIKKEMINEEKWQKQFIQYALPLLRDPALNEEIGRNGIQLVEERFAWEHAYQRFLGAYDNLPKID